MLPVLTNKVFVAFIIIFGTLAFAILFIICRWYGACVRLCVCVCEVRAARSAVLKLMTSYVAFAVIGLFVMLIFVDNVASKPARTAATKPRLRVTQHSFSFSRFYPRDAMLAQVLYMALCPSVCVCLTVLRKSEF